MENKVTFINEADNLPYDCEINGSQVTQITCFTSPMPAGDYTIKVEKGPEGSQLELAECHSNVCKWFINSSNTPKLKV
jgi:hypothetical protein